MSALSERVVPSGQGAAKAARNDNRLDLEIADGLARRISPERLQRAMRLLARRIVDRAMSEAADAAEGNR